MGFLGDRERTTLGAISQIAFCNPFVPDRTAFERTALQEQFVREGAVWSASVTNPGMRSPNVLRVHELLESLIPQVHSRMGKGATASETALYIDCAQYLLYQRCHREFDKPAAHGTRYRFYQRYAEEWKQLFTVNGQLIEGLADPAHVFACFRQLRYAFLHIFDNIIGNSMPAARLRASAWQSVFTHDLRRYHTVLWSRMHDFPTLITGPSGTGKELIARAIAGSRYIPFDAQLMQFKDPPVETFLPMNLAALSPALIESELFGHRKGSFTGAIGDRKGWLEACPREGSVFLDELGEMDLSIQVKILRVIETRRFSMVGDTSPRTFHGKLIAATNRDLAAAIAGGKFREDLYYRLCADQIHTPSLREQIDDTPGVLDDLILFMVRRSVGDEAERCFPEVKDWVAKHLPADYAWPGNYRELEQCVRNVIIRRSYEPLARVAESPLQRIAEGQLKMEELISWYASLVYRRAGSYEEAARRLDMDRRTVKAKVEAFLERTA